MTPFALRGRVDGAQLELGQDGGPAFTLRAANGGSSHGMVAMAFNPQTGGSKARIGYGPVPTALSCTQSTGVQAGAAVRRLTPLEYERLQGFPDEWTKFLADGAEQSDSARYRELGNAVAVPVSQWIAGRIAAVEARLAVAREVA